jgi:Spy/CpxP family protein refolding chaperone
VRNFRVKQSLAALLLLGVCASAAAGDRLAVMTTDRSSDRRDRLANVRECLSILDLSDSQKDEIRGILEAAWPGIREDARSVRASRQKLRADAGASPVDACLVGADYLALRDSLESLRATLESVRDQVAATLTAEQKAKLEGCLLAPGARSAEEDETEP